MVRVRRRVVPADAIAFYFIILLLLVAMTIGILQYRLFEIDVVINRTLVYGTVTALLAGAVAELSVVTQRLTLAITGQESEAAVVLAALVDHLRNVLVAVVDETMRPTHVYLWIRPSVPAPVQPPDSHDGFIAA